MFAIRNTRKSVIANIAAVFENDAWFTNPFNIYYDDDLKDQTVPVRPGLFILNFGLLWEVKHLPVVVVNPSFGRRAHELGTTWGVCSLELHVLGRTRDEADEIAGAIMHHIDEWTMYDYSTGTPVVKGVTRNEKDWEQEYVPVGTEFEREGTFGNWEVLTCRFLVPYYY